MKFAIVLTAAVLSVAGAASASDRITDAQYLKASRCKGLATGITGVVDAAQIDAYLKQAKGARSPILMDRADAEFDRAKREARSGAGKERLTAELTGTCSAYLGDPANVAKR
jgi:hypothetical protein